MTNKAAVIAGKLGISVEQVTGVLDFLDAQGPVVVDETGTTTARSLYSAEDLAASRARRGLAR